MELIRCHVENFGILSDKSFDFSDGLNAFCLENGQGKSTFCAFIKCMLYGLSESRRQDLSENERKHYAPWQGGRFGGSLTLRFDGRIYHISRSFGTRPAEDRMEVFDEQSGERTSDLGTCPGETMLGMDAKGFAICAAFSERAFESRIENESILSLLGREECDQNGSLSTALARLEEERRLYEKRGGRGLLSETEAEISALTAQRIAHLKTAEALPEKEFDLLAAKAALAALTENAQAKDREGKGKKTKKGTPLFLASILLSLLLIAIGFLKSYLFFLGIPFSAFLVFLSLFKHKEKLSLQNEADIGELKDGSLEEAKKKSLTFEELYQKCAACERIYEEALEAEEEASYLALKIEELTKKRDRLSALLSDIKKTEELLTLAGKQYRERRSIKARASFSKYLGALGEEDSENFRLGDLFAPSFLQGEGYHSAETLSRGEKDRVSLSRSLSLLSAIAREKRPPLLLDDPFLTYDDHHLSEALATLRALSQEYQILYLSCSKSRMP